MACAFEADWRGETRSYDYKGPGLVTTYTYGFEDTPTDNESGDLVEVSYSDSTPTVDYTYDRRGRTETVARNSITTTFTYNDANQLLTESYSGGTLAGLSVERTYNSDLKLDDVAVKDGSVLEKADYVYDATGRLETVNDGNDTAYSVDYGYHANSDLVNTVTHQTSSSDRLVTTKEYDFLNRLSSISSSPSGSSAPVTPVSYAYQYNAANQRTRVTLADGSYWIYKYDELGQVRSGKRYWSDGTPVAGQQFEYAHDDIGNRESAKRGGDENGNSLRSYNYDADYANRYDDRTVPSKVDVMGIANPTASVDVEVSGSGTTHTAYRNGEYFHHALDVGNNVYPTIEVTSNYGTGDTKDGKKFVPPSTEDFQYDDDGNLKSDGRWDYTWDGENRLIEMQRPESTPSGAKQWIFFEYDHQGRRIRKTFYTYNGGWVFEKDIIYLYDGWRLMAELDKENNNARIRTYIWGLDLSGSLGGAGGVGGLLKVADYTGTTAHHFAAYDGNGNLTALVDASDGSISARYAYGPFGEPVRATGTPLAGENPMRFSTKYTDTESGLVYYGFRYYNPDIGRWLSRDPIEERGGINLYTAIKNNLVDKFDPYGLQCFEIKRPNGTPAIIFQEGEHWELTYVEYLESAKGSGLTFYDGFKVTWEAKVNVLCCCSAQFVEKSGTRIWKKTFNDPNKHFFVGYQPGGMPINISIPKNFYAAIGQYLSDLIDDNLTKPVFVSPKTQNDIVQSVWSNRPKKPWDGKWKNKAPCPSNK